MNKLGSLVYAAYNLFMGDPSEKPSRRWGMRHTAIAGTVLTVGQLYALQEYVFTRKEGESVQSEVLLLRSEGNAREKEWTGQIILLNRQIAEINANVRVLIEQEKKREHARLESEKESFTSTDPELEELEYTEE